MPDVAYSAERARIFDLPHHRGRARLVGSLRAGPCAVHSDPQRPGRSACRAASRRHPAAVFQPADAFLRACTSRRCRSTAYRPVSTPSGMDAPTPWSATISTQRDTRTPRRWWKPRSCSSRSALYFATAKGRNGTCSWPSTAISSPGCRIPTRSISGSCTAAWRRRPSRSCPTWLRWGLSGRDRTGGAAGCGQPDRCAGRYASAPPHLARTSQHLDEVLRASPAVLYRLHEHRGQMLPDWVSPNILRLFGFSPEQVLTPDWWRQPPASGRCATGHCPHEDAFRRKAPRPRIPFLDAHGDTRYIRDEMHVTPARDGQPRTVFGTWNDLTESLRTGRTRRTSSPTTTRSPSYRTGSADAPASTRPSSRHAAARACWRCCGSIWTTSRTSTTPWATTSAMPPATVAALTPRHRAPRRPARRVGGDEFAVMLSRDAGVHHAIAMTERMLSVFATPMTALGQTLALTASIGISMLSLRWQRCRHAASPCGSGDVRGQEPRSQHLVPVR